jgi:putative transposase
VTSDTHPELVDAMRSSLPGAFWQRCRTHFMRNVLTRVPRAAYRPVATLVRSIFDQADADQVHEQYARVVTQLQTRQPVAS